jgi:nicotinate-nucleotide--dimethylbenzimidazole phosphoribosyltransferase
VSAKLGRGTRSSLWGAAMTREECEGAIRRGIQIARECVHPRSNILLLGEMGIGNTSAASLIMSGLCEVPVSECVGRGTGLDDQGFARKLEVLERVRERHRLDPDDPIGVLAAVGG